MQLNVTHPCDFHIIDLIQISITDEAQGEKAKESIRSKCVQYLERAEKLKAIVKKGHKKPIKDGESNSKYIKHLLR